MEERKRTMTREELHEFVWPTPIQTLATQFGLSDRGLAKLCERHAVPVPVRGHWAKLEAGQVPKKAPLRAVTNTDWHIIHIGGKVRSPESTYLATILDDVTFRRIWQDCSFGYKERWQWKH